MKTPGSLAAGVLLASLQAGCAAGHRVEMLRDSRPRAALRALEVRADLPAGRMRVSLGAAAELYALKFSYCRDHFRASSRFEPQGAGAAPPGRGLLEIVARPREGAVGGGAVEPNLMDLALSPGIPLDLRLSVGEGPMDLDLTALGVRTLVLHGGSGPSEVRFSAGNPRELEQMRFTAGTGPVRLSGLGWGQVKSLEFHGGSGGAKLDWNGPGPGEAAAFLDPGTGGLRLSFPRGLGVTVSGKGIRPGDLPPRFLRRGGAWVAPDRESADRHLSLVLDAGKGEVAFAWEGR